MVYCSINEWAVKKNYANFVAYDKEYPIEETLTDMLEEMSALMDDEMGNYSRHLFKHVC